jgi:hypothetical protein
LTCALSENQSGAPLKSASCVGSGPFGSTARIALTRLGRLSAMVARLAFARPFRVQLRLRPQLEAFRRQTLFEPQQIGR